ncbi:MAG: hypothetical protein HQ594_04165, partial [Candidatus Omnitrophica bacterium]|nr:hypothetical protein [Candidatus Omnitrophota bacterium]
MRKILIIIFLLVSVISAESFLGGYAEAENNADEKEQLAALSYELAHLHETSGEDKKAAEGYLQILANYPDDIPSFARAFSRLQLLCRKYSNRYKKSKSKKDPMEAYRAGKELDMFSASLKNVYDHYNMKGEYRKALHILNCLIRIEEKSMYYLDRGNIYLYGLNNPTKALDDFEKIMEIDPNHPTVYTDIGIANEFLGNYVKAKTAYNNAAKTSPQNHWVHYGLSRAKGMDLAADSQLVKDWYFMGHFDSSSKPGPIENQIIEELDIKKVYMSEDEEEFSWFRPFKENNFGFVNLSNIFMKKDFVRAYALTYVYSPKRRVVLFRIGCDDGAVLWVNENKLMDNLESQPPRVDDN